MAIKNHTHTPLRGKGWWGGIIKPKKFYSLPEDEGDWGSILEEIRRYFNWSGDWVLKVWQRRIPKIVLWRFAFEGTKLFSVKKGNSRYFAYLLDSAAQRFLSCPEEKVWEEITSKLSEYASVSNLLLKRLFDPSQIHLWEKVKNPCDFLELLTKFYRGKEGDAEIKVALLLGGRWTGGLKRTADVEVGDFLVEVKTRRKSKQLQQDWKQAKKYCQDGKKPALVWFLNDDEPLFIISLKDARELLKRES